MEKEINKTKKQSHKKYYRKNKKKNNEIMNTINTNIKQLDKNNDIKSVVDECENFLLTMNDSTKKKNRICV
jgi:Skp family chaperone for outer membrane proteins